MARHRRRKAVFILLILTLVTATRMIEVFESIRTIDFLAILACGMCLGALISVMGGALRQRSAVDAN